MTAPKPGQLVTINKIVYRAVKRQDGCLGCDLNDIILCPMVVDRRFEEPKINCALHDVILKRIKMSC